MFLLATIIILSYLVGSIPTSIIISKLFHGIDIREHGSGNAGGTNVMRVLGWKKGLLVILLDALKVRLQLLLLQDYITADCHFKTFLLLMILL
jgi:glycerol-3-phosphate acyltransferase PlsY